MFVVVCVCEQVCVYVCVCTCFVFIFSSFVSCSCSLLSPLSLPPLLFPFGLALVVNCSYYNLFYLCFFSLQQQPQQQQQEQSYEATCPKWPLPCPTLSCIYIEVTHSRRRRQTLLPTLALLLHTFGLIPNYPLATSPPPVPPLHAYVYLWFDCFRLYAAGKAQTSSLGAARDVSVTRGQRGLHTLSINYRLLSSFNLPFELHEVLAMIACHV